MRNIYTRSPYLVRIGVTASQTASKLELFVWKSDGVEPTTPNYTLNKKAASTTQIDNYYDISPFIRENIAISHVAFEGSWDEYGSVSLPYNWCSVKVKTYYETGTQSFTQSTDISYTATTGYTEYKQGLNAYFPINSNYGSNNYQFIAGTGTDTALVLYDAALTMTSDVNNFDGSFFSFILELSSALAYYTIEYRHSVTGVVIWTYDLRNFTGWVTAVGSYVINVPYIGSSWLGYDGVLCNIYLIRKLVSNNSVTQQQVIGTYQQFTECKYKSYRCSYIGRYGGVEFITFFKASEENISVKGTEYSRYNKITNYSGYGTSQNMQYQQYGQTNDFNVNGTKSIKLNTGWVSENYRNKIQDLMLSESIFITDSVGTVFAVQLKTKSLKLQKNINDKSINYTMEFDISSNIINNVI